MWGYEKSTDLIDLETPFPQLPRISTIREVQHMVSLISSRHVMDTIERY